MVKLTSPLINRLGKYSITGDDVVSFFWTAGGVEFVTTSSDLYIDVESCFEEENMEIWLTIEVDGALLQRINLPMGRSTICAFRKVEAGIPRTVRILRESQQDFYAKVHALRFHQIYSKDEGGLKLLTPPEHKLNIEFIGDSITSGEGLNGQVGEMSFVSAFYGFKNNYACLTSDALDAYFTVNSQSGWGLYCGFNNDMRTTMPHVYFKTEFNGESLIEDRPDKDIIVINLGTNDCVASTFPAWVDPKTNISYKLNADESGKLIPEDADKVVNAGVDFINKIRSNNPTSKILWTYGIVGDGFKPIIERICKETNIEYVWGKDCTIEKDYGSREHPGANTHRATSEILVSKIKTML